MFVSLAGYSASSAKHAQLPQVQHDAMIELLAPRTVSATRLRRRTAAAQSGVRMSLGMGILSG